MVEDAEGEDASAFLRFMFVVGQVAIHHTVCPSCPVAPMLSVQIYVDGKAEIVRRRIVDQEEAGEDDDPMGGVTSQQEMELDNLRNLICQELLELESPVGFYSSRISKFCSCLDKFVEVPLSVQLALSFALLGFMYMDYTFCQGNLRLMFSLLQHKYGV